MSRKPIVMFAQPDDQYFLHQCHLYIENCIQNGFNEDRIHVLLYNPAGRKPNESWNKLKTIYPKLNIFRYFDKGVAQHLGTYIPILRPHTLWQHFEAFPSLENEVIVYTDCDIMWTKPPKFDHLYNDDVCYISDAQSYLNNSYFESKLRDVLPEKLEEYNKRDVVKELCDIVGINKSIAIDNNNNTGGVQYILKNINSAFWKKVEKDVLDIIIHLGKVNKEFFPNENKGIQKWCADLWAMQYNLWLKGECKVSKDLIFSWATDNIKRIEETPIFHNAGVTSTMHGNVPMFYKGKYHLGQDPTKDEHLNVVLNNEESKKLCTWWYANELKKLSDKYKLDY